jgi:hypothetical protein
MNNSDMIIEWLKTHNRKYCDDCLSDILHISPRQQVNQICNRLTKSHEIRRVKDSCDSCNCDKLVNYIKN